MQEVQQNLTGDEAVAALSDIVLATDFLPPGLALGKFTQQRIAANQMLKAVGPGGGQALADLVAASIVELEKPTLGPSATEWAQWWAEGAAAELSTTLEYLLDMVVYRLNPSLDIDEHKRTRQQMKASARFRAAGYDYEAAQTAGALSA